MNKNISIELRALGKSLLLSILLCLSAATVVYYSGLNETLFPSLGKIILVSSIFVSGCLVSAAYGTKGLLRGTMMGLIFFIILFIATLIFGSAHIAIKPFIYSLLLCLVAGGLGGVLGIGLSGN